MKTIGLIGGMSWESTVTYYKIINDIVKEQLGGLHSAKIILYSVNFKEIEDCQSCGDWDKSGAMLADAAQKLERAGADFVLICTNTMHKVAGAVASAISIPLLHITDVTASALKSKNISKVALLGTKYTMEQDFYKSRFIASGIEVLIPSEKDRTVVNDIIFGELCLGKTLEKSKMKFLEIINGLSDGGASGVVLGCTEIGMLVNQKDTETPLFDTAEIHAKAAAFLAIKD